MSFSQFGYAYNAASQFFVSANPSTTCYDSISRSVCDGSAGSRTAPPVCCQSYGNPLIASTRTEPNAALRMYSPPCTAAGAAAHSYGNYFQYSTEASALCSALNSQYDIKEGAGNLHTGISQSAGYYSCDPTLGQYQYERYSAVDFNGSARRKNATRETTSTLKAWLSEHRKNPYPTKGEKIMLAIITKMTLTQVSTWFANARRRLKKENKMTWSAKNKPGETRREELEKPGSGCTHTAAKDCKEKHVMLSDEDDLGGELEGKQDSDCENISTWDISRQQAVTTEYPYRDSSGTLAAPSCLNTYTCCDKNAAVLASSCTAPVEVRVPAGPPSLTLVDSLHPHTSGKARIWSLAHTAATGHYHSSDSKSLKSSVTCHLLPSTGPAARKGQCAGPKSCQEMPDPPPHKKDLNASFSQNNRELYCPSYNFLSKSCQYLTSQGFSYDSRTETILPELRDTFILPQKDKAITFRSILKRFSEKRPKSFHWTLKEPKQKRTKIEEASCEQAEVLFKLRMWPFCTQL